MYRFSLKDQEATFIFDDDGMFSYQYERRGDCVPTNDKKNVRRFACHFFHV
jgi:hypothetical protein